MPARNNEERLGHREPSDSSPVPQAHPGDQPQSSPFSFVVPTEFVELPSRGKYYPKEHPLHNVETIEIKHMTAKEEDLLTSRSLLKKGLAISRVLESVIVDKRIDVDSLLIGDKNAAIVSTRISAYGADYQTQVTCPSCNTTSKFAFDLNAISCIHNEPADGVVRKGDNFVITLPGTKVNVEVKLLSGKDEKYLAEAMNMKRKHNLPDAIMTDQFKMFIVSINGHTDRAIINDFADRMPASDSRFLRTTYDRIVPNVDMAQEYSCDNCSYEAAMEVPLSADFFWPKS
ncbi:hypothetical protein CMI37_11010 [Candidatus Pacearchaeota archaeon]|nr:hypothetical protein [Candidatus Pacearchaeota archaeon]|tara:strand:+ start:2636 stop:3496 length:861 start_codon:yes stop_codon:yes gene_type:complete